MIRIRPGRDGDFDLLYRVDVEDEGISVDFKAGWTPEQWADYRVRIRSFLIDADKAVFIAEDAPAGQSVGLIAARFRNRDGPDDLGSTFLATLDRSIFPADGLFCEVFQLWVDPAHRRHGLATTLKRRLEEEAIARGVGMIYTHTEAANQHVIDLNLKLGYQIVRRGPIWDDVERVSMTKELPSAVRGPAGRSHRSGS